jgi:hypothetical protein
MAEQPKLSGQMPPMRETDGDAMPGSRAGMPEGSLSKPYFGVQGDENREPPANAPSPVMPGATVLPAGTP